MKQTNSKSYSDKFLMTHFALMVKKERGAIADVILHLSELGRRRLYLKEAYSSLFSYLVEKHHYCRSAAYRRIQAAKLDKKNYKVYCMLGDGEIQEGQIWETAMSAPKFQLDNLIVIIDANKGQIDGHTADVMDLSPLKAKWKAFNWDVQEIDGHNFEEIMTAYDHALKTKRKPHLIIAHTVKGKGVSFMEDQIGWHGIAPSPKERDRAIDELLKG